MKNKIMMAAGLAVIAVPAAGAGQVDGGYATLEECVAAGTASDTWNTWSYTCVQTSTGLWVLQWSRDNQTDTTKKGKKTR